jgi:hypothetical protein
MKTKFTALALFCTSLFIAQNRIFQNPVNENNLSSAQKITKDLASGYLQTKYYKQTGFDLKSDLQIPLPDGKEITARFDRTYLYSNKSESYVYRIDNDPKAELVLSKYDQTIAGMYSSGSGEKVMFHQTSSDIFALSSVSDSKLISQDSKDDYILDIPAGTAAKVNSNVCLDTTPVCPATRIDVMVVFTTGAKTAWGGLSQSNAFVATAVTNFNTALTNSGVSNVTINLVYSGEISYAESGNISTDLTRFRTNNDSYMDDIHTLRSAYGADICTLITSTPTNTCGLGYVNTNPTNYTGTSGFSVSLYNCAVSNYSLAHEMGHNMGLRHDWYVDTSTTPCSHHHGYTNRTAITLGASSVSSQRWRTIMAYNDECSATGFNCSRINRWANPGVNYNSEPTGIAIGSTNPANEAYAFYRFACAVSQFASSSDALKTLEASPQNKEFTLYPNPAKEVINISVKDNGKYTFKVFNALGQQMTATSSKSIDLKNWPSGEYFISIYDEKNTMTGSKKFIVQ